MIDPSVRLWRQGEVCRAVNKYSSDFDVNIQRGTIWGNPYALNQYDDPIGMYRKHFYKLLRDKVITQDHLETLRGMRLGCTCKPKKCHGDVIAEFVNKLFKDEIKIEDL